MNNRPSISRVPAHSPASPASHREAGKKSPLLVLGLGNPLMGDDGAGLLILDALKRALAPDERIALEDGGTLGMTLLPLIEDARAVVLLDAAHTGAAPGTVIVRRDGELPGFFSHILSPHQIGLREVLGAAQLCGTLPGHLALVGIEAESTGFAEGPGEAVLKAIPRATETACAVIGDMLAHLQAPSTPLPAHA